MYKSKQLREERQGIVVEMQDLARSVKEDERNFNSDELAKWENLEAREVELKEQIDTVERLEKVDSLSAEDFKPDREYRPSKIVTRKDCNDSFRAWLLRASGNDDLVSENWVDAAQRASVNLSGSTLQLRAGMDSSDSTAGGHTLNSSLVQSVDVAMSAYGGVGNNVQKLVTATGETIHFPTVDDTANIGGLIAQNTDTTSTDITFGSVAVGAYTVSSGVYPISAELIQDSNIDIVGFVGEQMGVRLARAIETYLTSGTGSSQPKGIVVGSSKGEDATDADGTASATEFCYANLVDLQHSVNAAYRSNPKCMWLLSDAALSKAKQLVDGNNRPLWMPSVAGGAPDTILGKPYRVGNLMDAVTTGKKPIIFGDMSKFIYRLVSGIKVKVLTERFAEENAVGVLAYARFDSDILNSAAIKHLLMA